MLFENLNLIEPVLRALKTEGYVNATPIQEQAIPVVLKGKDLLGCARTGTGKTAAFALPVLQLLFRQNTIQPGENEIRALIITPTRELAIQIDESLKAYGKYTGIKHLAIFGGVSQHAQTQALKKGIDILVATPGRLLDLVAQKFINLQKVQILVLDEADRMLDMGFVHDVKKIIARLPVERQTLFFSATMPPEISKLAHTILKNPVRVEVTPVSSTVEIIEQGIYFVEKKDKMPLLIHLLKNEVKDSVLIFTRTKHGADKIAKSLHRVQINADAIHGNKSQLARQRALGNFKNNQTRVLVATDIAARGIDVESLSCVINFDLPNVPETYVHRIGRTGRAGASGKALSFCDGEEKGYLRDISKLTTQTIPVINEHPYAMPSVTIPGYQQPARMLPQKQQRIHHHSPTKKHYKAAQQVG